MCNNSYNVTGNVIAALSFLSRICYAEEKTDGDNSGWGEEDKAFGFGRFARVELKGKPDVASETQDRMLSVIEDLGCTNLAARSLRSRAQNLVGVIMPDIACPFVVEGMQATNRATAESTFYPLVYTTDDVRKSGSAHTNPRTGRRVPCCVDAARALLTIPFQERDRRCKQSSESFFRQKFGTIVSRY
ncbi:MAG: LacI family DNA-binding transcriptional regulator [Anaerolineales bacterium]|nr:LacI family DNA-binding transcriptional regulator [Anaerolineales bacterium]